MPQRALVENPPFDSFPRSPRPEPGVWLTHKPAGVTSFSVVRDAQAALAASPGKAHSVCHAGALDPFATGLLPVLVGPVTRVFERLHALPKVYEATVQWGEETDTGDGAGKVVARQPLWPSQADVEGALASLVGWRPQVPPATSNKRVDGERAYRKAHRGEAVVLPATEVYLHSATVRSHAEGKTVLRLMCRGGFYVRALARDVARLLGGAAHVQALHRVSIGPWHCPVKGVERVASAATFSWWPSVKLSDAEWGQVRADQPLVEARVRAPLWRLPSNWPALAHEGVAWHQGRAVALLKNSDEGWRQSLFFPGGLFEVSR